MVSSRFESIGVYLPDQILKTSDLVSQLSPENRIDVERITGVRERRVYNRSSDNYEDSFTLGIKAAEDCLARSKYSADQLDVVISASVIRTRLQSRFYFEPSFAGIFAERIGAHRAIAFDISNACAGTLTGVYLLDSMIRAGVVNTGIVISGEQMTSIAETAIREISRKYDPQFGSLTVGDSGCAIILDRAEDDNDRIHYIDMLTASAYAGACLGMPSEQSSGIACYTDNKRMHNETRFLNWTNSQKDFLQNTGREFVSEGFDFVIHHQISNSLIALLDDLGEREFGCAMPRPLQVLEKYGNTATTSHFVVLYEKIADSTIKPGSKVLIVPSASGIVAGFLSATISTLKV